LWSRVRDETDARIDLVDRVDFGFRRKSCHL
jgi:hypothetical protein